MRSLIWLLLLFGGVFLLYNPTLFNGAHAIGLIATILGAAMFVFTLVLLSIATALTGAAKRQITNTTNNGGWHSPGPRRIRGRRDVR